MNRLAAVFLLTLSLALPAFAAEPAGAPAETLAKPDREFLEKALQASLTEVQMAEVALTKAQRKDVKDYAYMMSNDHGSDAAALRALAGKKNLTLPAAPSGADAAAIKKLREEPANTFDSAYIKANIKAHEDAVGLFKSASKDAKDPDVQAFAGKTVPVLEKHLETIRAISKPISKQ